MENYRAKQLHETVSNIPCDNNEYDYSGNYCHVLELWRVTRNNGHKIRVMKICPNWQELASVHFTGCLTMKDALQQAEIC